MAAAQPDMCGIIGYTGASPAAPILLEGLARLEYRGYDSAGIAVLGPGGEPVVHKSAGRLSELRTAIGNGLPEGAAGVGHTRWATHGGPTDFNAHPHMDCEGRVVVVHNGIVENYLELREQLLSRGHVFTSETDTECIPHLVESYLHEGLSLEEAVREAARRMRGSNVVVTASRSEPGRIVALRLGNAGGVVVGYGPDEMLVASDLPALIPYTDEVAYLDDGEIASMVCDRVGFSRLDGTAVDKDRTRVDLHPVAAARGSYAHFMLKEINEQPEAVVNTLSGRISLSDATVRLEDFPFTDEEVRAIDRVVLVGMGTSLHAAMVGRTWIETLAGIPAEFDNSSEFRYRGPLVDSNSLVVSVSQSGETADTLAAMNEAAGRRAKQITLSNYAGTQTTRIADGTMLIRAGMEIGVAASKTFVCSLTSLLLLAVYLGTRRGTLETGRRRRILEGLARLPDMLAAPLASQSQYEKLARRYSGYSNFLFLGRGVNYPLAMEGALKLKEISYIHAEGYAAGEMKHGPISLIDENMPVIVLAPRDGLYDKMLNNLNEVKARGGVVLAVATEGDDEIAAAADDVVYVPGAPSTIAPMLMAPPLQLLAYHIAVRRGCDVDHPRNLAKTVTVE